MDVTTKAIEFLSLTAYEQLEIGIAMSGVESQAGFFALVNNDGTLASRVIVHDREAVIEMAAIMEKKAVEIIGWVSRPLSVPGQAPQGVPSTITGIPPGYLDLLEAVEGVTPIERGTVVITAMRNKENGHRVLAITGVQTAQELLGILGGLNVGCVYSEGQCGRIFVEVTR